MTYYRRGLYFVPNTGRSVYYEAIKVHHDDRFIADIEAADCCNTIVNNQCDAQVITLKFKEELKQTI